MFAELYDAGAMPPDMLNYVWDDVANMWVQGFICMYTEWYGWYSYFQDPIVQPGGGQVRPGSPADGRRWHPRRMGR